MKDTIKKAKKTIFFQIIDLLLQDPAKFTISKKKESKPVFFSTNPSTDQLIKNGQAFT